MSERLLFLIIVLCACSALAVWLVGMVVLYIYLRRQEESPQAAPPQRITRLKPRPAAAGTPKTIAVFEGKRPEPDSPPTILATAAVPKTVPVITIEEGPHAGQTFVLHQLPARIGRSSDCAIRLDGDALVSRQHAELYQQDDRLCLRDLNSRHGTEVSGTTVTDISLTGSEPIRVGDSVLVITWRAKET
jgi:hypothetical protein